MFARKNMKYYTGVKTILSGAILYLFDKYKFK